MSEELLPVRPTSMKGSHSATIVDPDLVEAARILRGALVRVHPSFRFEERLAARLDAAVTLASGRDAPESTGAVHALGRFAPGRPTNEPIRFALLDLAAADAEILPSRTARGRFGGGWRVPPLPAGLAVHVPRGALIGGAIASGVSLAGAALLARRWSTRPSRSPFARAARAAHGPRRGLGRVARRGLA